MRVREETPLNTCTSQGTEEETQQESTVIRSWKRHSTGGILGASQGHSFPPETDMQVVGATVMEKVEVKQDEVSSGKSLNEFGEEIYASVEVD